MGYGISIRIEGAVRRRGGPLRDRVSAARPFRRPWQTGTSRTTLMPVVGDLPRRAIYAAEE